MKIYNKKKLLIFGIGVTLIFILLFANVFSIMVFDGKKLEKLARELHQRERSIKAQRGKIYDRTGVVLADNKSVCTISVIHSQIEDFDRVIEVLSNELGMDRELVKKRVMKVSGMERIASNVNIGIGEVIRDYNLSGVKVDEDYKRYYPYNELLSKVIGFTGAYNQGVLGLEVMYDDYLSGSDGRILTYSNASGVDLYGMEKERIEPISGYDLYTSLDYNISQIAYELAGKAYEEHNAKSVSIIVMNPKNGEIYTMVNYPEYNLNAPFEIDNEISADKDKNALLNQIWRNSLICDTYEPGSTFKMVTASIGLDIGVLNTNLTYNCPGFKIVDDRRIRCAKTSGHGAQTFAESVMNSCNPAFIEWGLRIGADAYYDNMMRFGLLDKTGIDLPGEAATIMHQKKNIKNVELATISFGQSFQITPVKMLQTTAMIINGGNLVTPHFSLEVKGKEDIKFSYPIACDVIKSETSDVMRDILYRVVEEGGGNKAFLEEYAIGGKTATSEKLPRGNGKYIASFIGFAPYDSPEVLAMCVIDEPEGVYYGGTIAAPVIRNLFEEILPYLDVEKRAS